MKCMWGGSWGKLGPGCTGLWCKDAWGSRYEKDQWNSSTWRGRADNSVMTFTVGVACSSSSGFLRLSWVEAKLRVYATLHFLYFYELPSSPDWTATVFLILQFSKNVLFKQNPEVFCFWSQLSVVSVLGLCIEPLFLKKKKKSQANQKGTSMEELQSKPIRFLPELVNSLWLLYQSDRWRTNSMDGMNSY